MATEILQSDGHNDDFWGHGLVHLKGAYFAGLEYYEEEDYCKDLRATNKELLDEDYGVDLVEVRVHIYLMVLVED